MAAKRHDLPSLLLLPFPPEPASRECFEAAYKPSLEAAISKSRTPAGAAVLVVAIACPVLTGGFQYGKTLLRWASSQSLVAGIYSIASAVCAKLSIAAYINGGPGSVDVRVVLIDHTRRPLPSPDLRPPIEPNNTVVLDLPTFAASYHPWNTLFFASTETGLQLRRDYLHLYEGKQVLLQDQLVAVPGGITLNIRAAGLPTAGDAADSKGHRIVCLGGTFDHLHAGHKLLLTGGALLLDVPRPGESAGLSDSGSPPSRFIIGVTGDELLKNKQYAELVQSWESRALGVINFLSTLLDMRPAGRKGATPGGGHPEVEKRGDGELCAVFRDGAISVECVRIQDAFGPTITLPDITALVVSAETSSGGQAVNDRRVGQGWEPLQIYVVDVLDAAGGETESPDSQQSHPTSTAAFASKISSTAIRKAKAEGV